MPQLQHLSLTKFRDITWKEFMETDEFTEECTISSEFGPLDKSPTNFFHNENIKNFISDKPLEKKKKILLYSFYLNTLFKQLTTAERAIEVHLGGVFLFLVDLEEEFEKPKKKNDKNEMIIRKFFFDVKRRFFNIFFYFNCYPRDLEAYIQNFIETINTRHVRMQIMSNLSTNELNESLSRLLFKKKRCLLEYFKHYTLLQEKVNFISDKVSAQKYLEQVPLCVMDTVTKNKDILSKKAIRVLQAKFNT